MDVVIGTFMIDEEHKDDRNFIFKFNCNQLAVYFKYEYDQGFQPVLRDSPQAGTFGKICMW